MDVGVSPGQGKDLSSGGGPGGGEARDSISVNPLRITGSALRLEESRDGRWDQPRSGERFIEWGKSRRGRGSGFDPGKSLADSGNGRFA